MDKAILIQNGHIVDPSQGIDGIGDMLVEDGKIAEIRIQNPESRSKKSEKFRTPQQWALKRHSALHTIDATGLYLLPGLVDMHTHLREPGFEYKETIKTGTMAAVRGGFTSVCCMPNTKPVNDNATVTGLITGKAVTEGFCSVFPIGAITKGQEGQELSEMGMMSASGCVAFSDDGRPVMSGLVMRRALEYSGVFKALIISHCEDLELSDNGVMNEGIFSMRMGLKGIPDAAEEVMTARDLILAGATKGRLHIAHVSTKGSVELIRRAKMDGINVTAETCPHYFSITEKEVEGYNTDAKVNPPLRTHEDAAAIIEGLRDGTIDVIATDHAPHHRDEKLLEFDRAPSGISGLETALSLSLRLVHDGILTMPQLVEKMALNPSRILGIGKGTLKAGADADLVLVDLNKEFKVETESFASKGRNTPFEGWVLKGRPVITICRGKVYE